MSEEDDETWLWKEVTKEVKTFDHRKSLRPEAELDKKDQKPKKALKKDPADIKSGHEILDADIRIKAPDAPEPDKTKPGSDLDRRTEERLRRGQMKIDGRIDLHGHRLHEAQRSLQNYLQNAYTRGHRCILVITGRGTVRGDSDDDWMDNKPGVIKQHTPKWLSEPPLRDIVLKSYPAQPKDGGAGALYVLLRRQR